jgi:hypothetical protein
MKKIILLFSLVFICIIGFTYLNGSSDEPVYIPPSKQRTGNAAKGYEYLITGDYLKSGIPYRLFKMAFSKDTAFDLNRNGFNKTLPYQFNAVKAPNGVVVVAPNCLQCHAQIFEGKVVVGMGNSFSDFTTDRTFQAVMVERFLQQLKNDSGKNMQAAKAFITSMKAISRNLVVPTRGVNAANHLAALLIAQRDPATLKWSDSVMIKDVGPNIPTDVPAWWLLKKKHAMFYNGNGRGDFGKFLMASNLLTVSDTSEAREVDEKFDDVLAYIKSIPAPVYPGMIDKQKAAAGQVIFQKKCEGCHGSYSKNGKYPNLLIPNSIIKTDSMLSAANYSNPETTNWFNNSWFSKGDHPARLVPFNGYIAPPLDGVWATAPYLHNGSVPSLSMMLDSKSRPKYWKRDFNNANYNYTDPGWSYEVVDQPGGSSVYNTTIPGYTNTGHEFGDRLSKADRDKLLEYLKTL